ncbi:type II toxin-antitoxin system HicA family toxin [Brevibacillus sp. SIMBA_040]|uniref:type II toxin-antitoxin system HicA family toxin n=1 Tax=unclassified Brevibacillus TaxID=2684853 RepID=UPI00397B340C
MKSYSSRDMIKIIEQDGWYLVRQNGSHRQYKHPNKVGLVTIPHPRKDLKTDTIRSILSQAGL